MKKMTIPELEICKLLLGSFGFLGTFLDKGETIQFTYLYDFHTPNGIYSFPTVSIPKKVVADIYEDLGSGEMAIDKARQELKIVLS